MAEHRQWVAAPHINNTATHLNKQRKVSGPSSFVTTQSYLGTGEAQNEGITMST